MMTERDIEKMLEECGELDMSHVKKEDILAKAKQEIYFGASKKEESTKKKSSFPLLFTSKRFVPIVAGAALAVTLCFGMIGLYNENFQTVYIDINPSVALKLNRFDRVIGVEYLNDDAKNLLSNVKLVGTNSTDALSTIITACDTAGYVNANSEIYISATAKDDESSEKTLQKLKGHAETMREVKDESCNINTYNAKKNDKKDYKKESLSPAKYELINEIIAADSSYTLEMLKNKSMKELNDIKRALLGYDDDFDKDDHEKDHGKDYDDDRDDRDDHDDDNDRENKNEKPSNDKPDRDNDRDDDEDDDDRDDHDEDKDDDEDEKKPSKKPSSNSSKK